MNNMSTFRGQLTCDACLEQALMHDDNVKRGEVLAHIDPTICVNCGYDNGGLELGTLSGAPTCESCTRYFRNRPFPRWLKISLVALALVIVLHLVHHRRFWLAYLEIREAKQMEDVRAYAPLYDSAAQKVPESRHLQAYSAYLMGFVHLTGGRDEAALLYLERCGDMLPPDYEVDWMISSAKCGVAFDQEDYDEFLEVALRMIRGHRDDPIAWGRVASAYACKYADTGDVFHYEKALASLDSARARGPGGPGLNEYEMRIRHRLHTRDVIGPDEFYERYPNGWVESEN